VRRSFWRCYSGFWLLALQHNPIQIPVHSQGEIAGKTAKTKGVLGNSSEGSQSDTQPLVLLQ